VTKKRDIVADVEKTNMRIKNKENVARKEKSWLGHTLGGSVLDYELLNGASLEELARKSNREISSVKSHFNHLKKEHGIDIIEDLDNGIFKMEILSIKTNKVNNLDSYKQYEKHVYDWLMSKHQKDNNFTFSLRRKASKGAEIDYFIGTEKSKYFGTTFWNIPVGYPGSSADCIDVFFEYKRGGYGYKIEFSQTKSPNNAQNKSALKLVKSLKNPLHDKIGLSYQTKEISKIFSVITNRPKDFYDSIEEMLIDVEKNLKVILPLVDSHIEEEKLINPEFVANRWTGNEFKEMHEKMQKRFEKYKKNNTTSNQSAIIKEQFSVWLKGSETSNKINSYLRAIDILNEILDKDLYLEKDIQSLNLLYQDLINEQRVEDGKYYYEKAPSYGNNGFYSASVKAFIDFLEEQKITTLTSNIEMDKRKHLGPLNKILYGPPGTGKTYNTVTESVAIIQNKTSIEISDKKRDIVKHDFDTLLKKNQILFTTFHQSMSYEDFVEGIKPKIVNDSDQETDEITYEVTGGIFKLAVARAAYNSYREYHNIGTVKYSFSQLYDAFIETAKDKIIKEDYLICKTKTGSLVEIYRVNKNDSIKARAKGSHASHVAPLTKENIQKLYDTYKSIDEIKNLQEVRDVVGVSPRTTEFYAVFASLLKFEKESFNPTNENEELLKLELIDEEIVRQFDSGVFTEMSRKYGDKSSPVVLIIDEINRGNVSAIFGELITLLEDDKRLGRKNELLITLPYSKNQFSVPSNLFVVGTMNTADRSVEALDTALRRRFDFKEMMPDLDVIKNEEVDNVKLSEVLKTINERIELLIDRDHTIGHSYFCNVNNPKALANAFNNKIVPLLQEYFYGDYGKIGLVLGKGFVEKIKNDTIDFASFEYDNANDFKTPTFIIKQVDSASIIEAVTILLAIKEPKEVS
jgi:hypothetical protein